MLVKGLGERYKTGGSNKLSGIHPLEGSKDGVETKHSAEFGDQIIGKNDWGVDGTGYFYISYYDTSISGPETMTFGKDLDGEEFYTHAYDFLPARDGFYVVENNRSTIASANVFTAASDEKVLSVSTRTDEPNSTVTFAIYQLGADAQSPTDGALVEKLTRTYNFAGFHRADLMSPLRLKEGERFSVVSTVSYKNGEGATVYEIVSNKSMNEQLAKANEHEFYGKAVVNKGESFVYDRGAWRDWADIHQEDWFIKDVAGHEVDNFSIKAYAVPWDGTSFPDVTDATSHADEIRWLATSQISQGYPDGTFRPMFAVTRQDMAAFLFRLAELWGKVDRDWQPTDEQKAAFLDVDENTPHFREIMWLAASKISTGFPDNTFRPMDSVKCQDMAAFLYRLNDLDSE